MKHIPYLLLIIIITVFGENQLLAAEPAGTGFGWGTNINGLLADNTISQRLSPTVFTSASHDIKMLAAGTDHTLSVTATGGILAAGRGREGQLGIGQFSLNTQKQLTSAWRRPSNGLGDPEIFTNAVAVAAGTRFSLAVDSDGSLWVCGEAQRLGFSDVNDRAYFVENGLTDITRVSAAVYHSLALSSDGRVWAFGAQNGQGMLGNGTCTTDRLPGRVRNFDNSADLSGITAVAAGGKSSLAVDSEGKVWAWGANDYGQLADGSQTDRSLPVRVMTDANTEFVGAVAVAVGRYHTVFLKGDGTVWSCGRNNHGQLGNGTTADAAFPVQVQNSDGDGFLSDVVAIATQEYHTLALKSDGTVWGWGCNLYGQLGNGGTTSQLRPVRVTGVSGVTRIAAGMYHSLAVSAMSLAIQLPVEQGFTIDWVYQNTAVTTADRHKVVLQISIQSDPAENTTYSATCEEIGTERVSIATTGNPLVFEITGGRRGVATVGPILLRVTVNGTTQGAGGTGVVEIPLTVRPLGDVNGNGS